jgi:hypothetical protein
LRGGDQSLFCETVVSNLEVTKGHRVFAEDAREGEKSRGRDAVRADKRALENEREAGVLAVDGT